MRVSTPVHLLEKDPNKRGDLFTSLMNDLFISLGYEKPRLNIHKTGRELDAKAEHRIDGSLVVAECKATKDKPGGTDFNKFFGVLDGERRLAKNRNVIGYFVSLCGFTESAEEMEREHTPPRFVRLNADGVVKALIQGGRPVTREEATEQAGRCVGNRPTLKLDRTLELIVHARGLYWAVCYQERAARSHIVLIAADGTPATLALAQEILAGDRECEGELHKLTCLNPAPTIGGFTPGKLSAAKDAWHEHLEADCGTIQIEGISGDQHVLERRFQIEQLFIPQRLSITDKNDKTQTIPVSAALTAHPRLAILAPPGGGKSTLVKRLAVAYADSDRRSLSEDHLPERDWLPILLRCRELRSLASRPFGEILIAIAAKPHLHGHDNAFIALTYEALNTGTALILVDGLDEISDPAARTAFVCTLRAALDAWPNCALVITSREAGFRHVAAHLAPFCTQSTLSPFNEDDIRNLTRCWHVQIDGDTALVQTAANTLATRIISNDRIRQLAINPLLLTTLFLVKRQTGDLPTGRAKLYAEAVKVLLWTWNIEGSTRIDPDDAVPRLAWVAHAMLVDGVQRISKSALQRRLHEANGTLENTFGLRHLDPSEFVERIETRSSLLMMTGQDVEDGQLRDFYEFRHLTFQEFLTAIACVEGYHTGRRDTDTLASVLDAYLDKEKWREVIPLAAVMAGRQTAALLSLLAERAQKEDALDPGKGTTFALLCQCLADEAPVTPALLDTAIRALLKQGGLLANLRCENQLWRSRYSFPIRKTAAQIFLNEKDPFTGSAWGLASFALSNVAERRNVEQFPKALVRAIAMLAGQKPLPQASTLRQVHLEGALLAAELAYEIDKVLRIERGKETEIRSLLQSCQDAIVPMLFGSDIPEQLAAILVLRFSFGCDVIPTCLVEWINRRTTTPPNDQTDIVARLLQLGVRGDHPEIRVWSLMALREVPWESKGRGLFGSTSSPKDIQVLMNVRRDSPLNEENLVKLKVLWYRHSLYANEGLLKEARRVLISLTKKSVAKSLRDYLLANGIQPARENTARRSKRRKT